MINGSAIAYVCMVLISGIFSVMYAKYDASVIHIRKLEGDGRNLDHNLRTVVRFGFCALLAVYSFGFSYLAILGFLICLSSFYLIFDIWLNDERGLDLFYLGYTSKVDRWAIKVFNDKVEQAGIAMFISEAFLLVLWSVLYFQLYDSFL